MLQLDYTTTEGWLTAVFADFDAFLLDHAACERKASATGMAFVVRYPDRTALLEPLIAFAREELGHFHEVYRRIEARGLTLGPDTRDPYVSALSGFVRTGRDERLLDRLVLAAVIEARGCERFGLVAQGHPDAQWRAFYTEITRSEARHHGLFVRLAEIYFSRSDVQARVSQALAFEADVMANLPIRAALH